MYFFDSCTCFCWFRASDKKRNLAQEKAEAQRRLYGHGSMKKLSAASSDWEKQRHTLERRREELVQHKHNINKYNFFKNLLQKDVLSTTAIHIYTDTHIPISVVKPQFSLPPTDQLQWSIGDAQHLYRVVHVDCSEGSWAKLIYFPT